MAADRVRRNMVSKSAQDGNLAFEFNKFFDKIYCVNLDDRPGRWRSAKKRFKKLNINAKRFSAACPKDGEVKIAFTNILRSKKKKTKKARDPAVIKNMPTMGCLISHLRILKNAQNAGYKRILIFEDDIIFAKDFLKRANKIYRLKNWDLLYLGSSQHSWKKINTKEAKRNGVYKSWMSTGTFAYAINSSAFEPLIKLLSGKKYPVDHYLTIFQSQRYKSLCYTLYPHIVISDVTKSDIRQGRSQPIYAERFRWNIISYDY